MSKGQNRTKRGKFEFGSSSVEVAVSVLVNLNGAKHGSELINEVNLFQTYIF